MADDIPQWAKDRACALVEAHPHSLTPSGYLQAFARYIAAHEEPPADPLLIEAREVAAKKRDYTGRCGAQSVRDGYSDEADDVQLALAALKRGIELGQSEETARA